MPVRSAAALFSLNLLVPSIATGTEVIHCTFPSSVTGEAPSEIVLHDLGGVYALRSHQPASDPLDESGWTCEFSATDPLVTYCRHESLLADGCKRSGRLAISRSLTHEIYYFGQERTWDTVNVSATFTVYRRNPPYHPGHQRDWSFGGRGPVASCTLAP